MKILDLAGEWDFCLDEKKEGISREYFKHPLGDKIVLPGTVATAKKGVPSDEAYTGYLTDPWKFEGYTWYSREISMKERAEYFLFLERTRISHVWIDDEYVGSADSLCTSHKYCLTPYPGERRRLTIMIDNTSYPVGGGHMTSPDTQTNWNGIVGQIYLEEREPVYLDGFKIVTDIAKRSLTVGLWFFGAKKGNITVHMEGNSSMGADESQKLSGYGELPRDGELSGDGELPEDGRFQGREYTIREGYNTFHYECGEDVELWSEHNPALYCLHILFQKEEYTVPFGFRSFVAGERYFLINGSRTFLRGKHDGLVFPLTGHAPMNLEDWLCVLGKAKEYGINHYRFHTCCPPKACFEAADRLGIYLEPELPFWGTITAPGEEGHDEEGQQYLIKEGFRILDEFGNHPSFVMMSLGNELWGSKERLNQILHDYKKYDSRPLYTQGSNNFQFVPCILEEEDFFCGVRFSAKRLIRGSYAMCDAPLGHIQTKIPNMLHNYDEMIRPAQTEKQLSAGLRDAGATDTEREYEPSGEEYTIQYGTGIKTVKAGNTAKAGEAAKEGEAAKAGEAAKTGEIIPMLPVVSHEVGQYAMFPDFSEIEKYTGVLKPRNIEIMRRRMEEKGMLFMAERFFLASGAFAVQCYKAEIEAAIRSNEMAGFQLLDLQDFPGQGTALVGVLNAFMESKGLIAPKRWREFCGEKVLMALLPKMIFEEEEEIDVRILTAVYSKEPLENPEPELILSMDGKLFSMERKEEPLTQQISVQNGIYELGTFRMKIPELKAPGECELLIRDRNSGIQNTYDIWVYPHKPLKRFPSSSMDDLSDITSRILITTELMEACKGLREGRKVLFCPSLLTDRNSLPITYCTDFWCFPMFRSISESMGKPVPIGTHGLYIETSHPAVKSFGTREYTTPKWYDLVEGSRAIILDELEIEPIVWTIDNFERCHKLGNLFEMKVGTGSIMVCTLNLVGMDASLGEIIPGAFWLGNGIREYMESERFNPRFEMEIEEFMKLFL